MREVNEVRLQLVGAPTDLSIFVARPTRSSLPTNLSQMREVASLNGAGTDVVFGLGPNTRTRYVTVWLRSLPEISADQFRGEIRTVTVSGR